MTDPIVDALIAERDRYAKEALIRVGAGEAAYEYGYRVGMYAGLEHAIQRVLKLYEDEKGIDI